LLNGSFAIGAVRLEVEVHLQGVVPVAEVVLAVDGDFDPVHSDGCYSLTQVVQVLKAQPSKKCPWRGKQCLLQDR
jgi:hypothetical protein